MIASILHLFRKPRRQTLKRLRVWDGTGRNRYAVRLCIYGMEMTR